MNASWKEDFPVSWTDDHVVTRREFTRSLVLVSCAAFASNGALIALDSLERRRRLGNTEPRRIGLVSEIPVGGAALFDFPTSSDPCLLVRLEEDRFVAYSQKCTHLGCPVLFKPETRKLHCPCHEGWFDAMDGSVLSGPPPRALPRIEIERRGEELWATAILQ